MNHTKSQQCLLLQLPKQGTLDYRGICSKLRFHQHDKKCAWASGSGCNVASSISCVLWYDSMAQIQEGWSVM